MKRSPVEKVSHSSTRLGESCPARGTKKWTLLDAFLNWGKAGDFWIQFGSSSLLNLRISAL